MPEFYFDKRENRVKPIPDCARYGLTWNASEQRCKYYDCVEQIMNVLDVEEDHWEQAAASQYQGWQGMGYLPAPSVPTGGGGGGFPAFDPISAVVQGVFQTITGLIQGAKQRGSDEARSGVALQSSVDSIYYMQSLVQSGRATKTEAYDAFYTKILPAFYNFILTLTTKSVVESRLNNQVPDLKNLFEKEVMSLPDPVVSPPVPVDDDLPDATGFDEFDDSDFGYIENYGDDGSYYYEDDQGWYYEDASGNWQQQDSDGNLYAGTIDGEYWETDVDGTSYWESSDGSYYQEYQDGSWISGDALGNECTGDVVGNWICEDGSAGGDWRDSPIRIAKQQGQTRRQGQISTQSQIDKYIKQGIALIPKGTLTATNQQRASTAIGTRQAANAQERLLSASPKSSGSGSGSNVTTLLVIGGIVVGFLILRNR